MQRHALCERNHNCPFKIEEPVYAWRAADEQAVCASWIGRHAEAFELCRRLVARPDLPEGDRQRIATNRDFSVPAMIEAAAPYPDALAQSLAAGPGEAEVTVSLDEVLLHLRSASLAQQQLPKPNSGSQQFRMRCQF